MAGHTQHTHKLNSNFSSFPSNKTIHLLCFLSQTLKPFKKKKLYPLSKNLPNSSSKEGYKNLIWSQFRSTFISQEEVWTNLCIFTSFCALLVPLYHVFLHSLCIQRENSFYMSFKVRLSSNICKMLLW